MKLSSLVAVMAISAAVCGCRYDKAGSGSSANGDGSTDGSDIGASDTELVSDAGNIDDLSAGQRFADKYTLCGDVAFAPVYFSLDAANVSPSEMLKIDLVVKHLNENADRVVSIEGNCDERGSNEYNMELGSRRAEIIRDYILQNGIDQARIETLSNGEEKPAAEGSNEGAWSKNRRGEFVIYRK